MTAIAIWRNTENPDQPTLWAVADSLVSRGPAPLIGDAAKLFMLPVTCRVPGPEGFFSEICSNHSYGYAFAGSTLVGQNTYLALVPLLTNLIHREPYSPSLSEVGAYIANYLSATFDDLRVTMGRDAMFEVAIFGWCPVQQTLGLFKIRPVIRQDGMYGIESNYVDFSNEQFVYLGDSSREVCPLIAAAIEAEGTTTRAPKRIIAECIMSDDYPSIGGDIQVAVADRFGFKPYMLYRPRTQPPGGVEFTYLGRVIEDGFRHLGSALVSIPSLP